MSRVKDLLKEADLTQSAFGRIVGVTPKAVNAWANEHQEPPKWALAFLRLYIGIRNLIKETV